MWLLVERLVGLMALAVVVWGSPGSIVRSIHPAPYYVTRNNLKAKPEALVGGASRSSPGVQTLTVVFILTLSSTRFVYSLPTVPVGRVAWLVGGG